MTELKPCPFCGSEAELNESESGLPIFSIWCKNENCIAGAVQVKDFNKERLVNAWNTRAEFTCVIVRSEKLFPISKTTAKTIVMYTCSKCKNVIDISDDYCRWCGAKVVEQNDD